MNTSIALFRGHSNAELYQRRLNEVGIPAEIHDCVSLKNGARLEAPTDQFERAYRLMLDWDAAESGLRGAIRCPECRSLRIEYPQYSHKSITPNLFLGLLTNLGVMRKEFYCQDCHYTWPRQGTKPSRARPHMAPYYFIEGIPQTPQSESRHPAHTSA